MQEPKQLSELGYPFIFEGPKCDLYESPFLTACPDKWKTVVGSLAPNVS